MKTNHLACLLALIAGSVLHAQSVTATGDVKPGLSPNPTDSWNAPENIVVGDTASGSLTISNGGSVTANGGAGSLTLGREWNGSGVLNFGSTDLANPTTGGTLNVSQIIFGEGDGLSINFNQTDDVLIAANILHPIFNFGRTIYQRGTGSTTLSGQSPDFWGDIKVNDGSLAITGVMQGRDMTVSGTDAATFRVTNGGTLSAMDFYIANEGNGHLVIDGGGNATNNVATIGAGENTGSVLVSGAGSVWNVKYNLHVGYGGTGTLTIADGATVNAGTVGGALHITENSDSVGTLNIGSADLSNLTTGGTLNATSIVFGNGYGDVGAGTINFNQTDDFTVSAPISGDGSINQRGSGVTTLTGTNTYTGATTITGGTLALRDGGSIAHSSLVLVGSGATLDAVGSFLTFGEDQVVMGSGVIAGEITIQGLLSVGDGLSGAGLLSFSNSLTLAETSTLLIELGGYERGASFDAIDTIGDYALNGRLLVSLLNSFTPEVGDTFNIFDTTYSGRGAFTDIAFLNSNFVGSFDAATGVLTITGVAAIPEPSTVALIIGLTALGAVTIRRRRTLAATP